ncbi:hypothetical protein BURPS1710A_A2786 [Burkholderia pseudomallei 1710a]|uniref:Uncharacterized protein n=1 Tax=Burkholderia pseudomallei 1710a TaxID=320371 RepID=A0A0E1VXS9_BURPE|nr:hypothetical protein BURPS1710A_A2786 [Burkholderia pseudomallei 1710a]
MALGARRSALGARRSALGARRSALGARRSALGAWRSALGEWRVIDASGRRRLVGMRRGAPRIGMALAWVARRGPR